LFIPAGQPGAKGIELAYFRQPALHFLAKQTGCRIKPHRRQKACEVPTARFGPVGPGILPWRCGEAEKVLKGKRLNRDRAAKAAAAAMKDAEPLAHNEYKIPLFRGLIEQQLMAIAQAGSR
jgi:CO/xanthine dehydrogenase FAD-binding subunit